MNRVVNRIARTFLKGLVAVLPIAITLYALIWLAVSAETLMQKLIPGPSYVPGLGIVVGLVVIYLVGVLLNMWVAKRVLHRLEDMLDRIPLIKTVYGSVKDLLGFFMSGSKTGQGQVVMVQIGDTDMRLIGLMTREIFTDLPDGVGGENQVAVYIPMSYNLGGYTVIVPRSRVTKVEMSTEEALRFAVTAGIKAEKPNLSGAV